MSQSGQRMIKVNRAMTGQREIYFHVKGNNGPLPKINPFNQQMTSRSHNRNVSDQLKKKPPSVRLKAEVGEPPWWPIHWQSGSHLADHDNKPLHPTSNATANLSKFAADFAHIPCLMELCCYKSLIGGTCGFSSSSCTL